MSKRAALFHWMIFGVLAALGLFMMLNFNPELNERIPGMWHLGMVWTFQDVQIRQLGQDNQIRDAAYQIMENLPDNLPKDFGCGKVNDIPLLNDGAKLCNVFLQNIFLDSFKETLGENFLSKYSEIRLSGEDVIGIAKENEEFPPQLVSSIPMVGEQYLVVPFRREYNYNPSFRINLGTKLDEFQQFQAEAGRLLGQCRGKEDLEACIINNLPNNLWDAYTDCSTDREEQENKVSFCVFAHENLYNFALDFNLI